MQGNIVCAWHNYMNLKNCFIPLRNVVETLLLSLVIMVSIQGMNKLVIVFIQGQAGEELKQLMKINHMKN